jgi:beta-lactam-binding protein with PASTA domain
MFNNEKTSNITSKKEVLAHIGIIIGLFLAIVLFFFYVYLPYTTNHGESVTVPDLTGMKIDELEDFLDSKDLRYQINDSTYDPKVKPLTVLSQYPKPGSKVKEDRKIYLTIRAIKPPQVKMPALVDASILNAQMVIQSYGLVLGTITNSPHYAENVVLKQMVNGVEILPGTSVSKGTRIDLVIGNGSGDVVVDIPSLLKMPLDEALLVINGLGVEKGSVIYDENSKEPVGTVIKQKPTAEPGKQIKAGEYIDLWVSGKKPENSNLDEEIK